MSDGGFSKQRLARLHDTMAGFVDRGEVPGLVTVVSRGGEIHLDTFGTKCVGGGGPIEPDTIFRISSMSKPVTAVATMLLVEECTLRLDEPVDRLLPELADRRVLRSLDSPVDDTVPANRAITVRDLLTFRLGTGGLMAPPGTYPIQEASTGLNLGEGPPQPSVPPPPDEWIRRFASLPLLHQPGEQWMYNAGSDVLSVLVARAAGQPFDVFLRERLFGPLGMDDTGFSVSPSDIDRLTASYMTNPETGALELYDEARGGQWSRPPAFPSGAGGLVSTAGDYSAFAHMLLRDGMHDGERILSRPSVELMTTDHLTPAQKARGGLVDGFWENHGWGFGVSIVTRRDDVASSVGSYGWDGGMGTTWSNDPAEDMALILMTGAMWSSPAPPEVAVDFRALAYQAIDD